ncbi:short chain dehydrogenase [Caprobacter fermentans]|uniref:SDR family oxidoreductase n=1 Tax=Caproicibacter fermentans TaxID=2576756 RepID=A0A6N8HVX1_9FIRM|nr:SDR family oxidoreductase [Caproicibacter fermentans]MVB09707.1 short chain dehydrogenase [Caproicibacter fermentans]OCN03116.1 ketoacyl reductase [Clostridium sp. W14A]QNK42406.1 SDR family oxidoreductase [Caproicibacter fermentans]
MKALITGASSGIGRDFARELSKRGYDLVLAARRVPRMEELARQLQTHVSVVGADLSLKDQCYDLYRQVRGEEIDVLINCAGFGVFGPFDETDLERELNLINVNIRAVHILTKLFYRDFKQRDSGHILNVSSSAAFQPGPLLSSYYASKAYVLRLTQALAEELRRDGSRVYIGALCPGPVHTEFDSVADVRFSVKGLSSEYVARYAVQKMFARKTLIVPGFSMKAALFGERFLPESAVVRIAYHMQKRKTRPGP